MAEKDLYAVKKDRLGSFLFLVECCCPSATTTPRSSTSRSPPSTPRATPVDIPAVPAQVTQELMRTRETRHWTDGPPPSPAIFKGMPVIE